MRLIPEHNWEKYYTLTRGDIFVEAGAYWGSYVMIASKKVGEQGRVIAIEPSPINGAMLEHLVQTEGLKNITIVRKALWSNKGRRKFCMDGDLVEHKLAEIGEVLVEVEVDTIDNILEELQINAVNLLAADVEGAEIEMIKGSEKSLDEKKLQNLAIAVYHLGNNHKVKTDFIDFLTSKSYKDIRYEEGVVFAHS